MFPKFHIKVFLMYLDGIGETLSHNENLIASGSSYSDDPKNFIVGRDGKSDRDAHVNHINSCFESAELVSDDKIIRWGSISHGVVDHMGPFYRKRQERNRDPWEPKIFSYHDMLYQKVPEVYDYQRAKYISSTIFKGAGEWMMMEEHPELNELYVESIRFLPEIIYKLLKGKIDKKTISQKVREWYEIGGDYRSLEQLSEGIIKKLRLEKRNSARIITPELIVKTMEKNKENITWVMETSLKVLNQI